MIEENILTDEQCCRWLALFECLHIVSNSAERRGLDAILMIDKLKPHAIQEFIDSRYPEIEENMQLDRIEKKGGFVYDFLYGNG